MNNLRVKILLSLTIFALILVIVVSYVNRQLLVSNTRAQAEEDMHLIENHIVDDMKKVDKAHYYFDTSVSDEMQTQLDSLVELYKQNPNVYSWDIERMKKEHGMDIYILDRTNTVIHTTFKADLGWSFSECCGKFSALLDERRQSGKFYTDGLDVSTTTGEMRKFSYLASPDNNYLFEVSIKVDDVPVYKAFNFNDTAVNLVDKYDDLHELKVMNTGGVFLNSISKSKLTIAGESLQFQKAFEQARKTMKPVEYQNELGSRYIETVRFIPYEAENIRGESTKKVIYVKYGNNTELALLKENTKQFWFLLILALIITVLTLFVIIRILTKTITLATYDTLTGVYNRATYVNKMEELIQKRKSNRPGLLLVDLDNFKQVNDQFGHTKGDFVLIEAAKVFEDVVKKDGFVARFGGDEFAIVVQDATPEKLREIGHNILEQFSHYKNENLGKDEWEVLSVSIGGALYDEQDEMEVELFVRADQALYRAKNNGKNQYAM
ncbi:MAG: GGDEF domain-containing protein [Lysinibacillus sp.]